MQHNLGDRVRAARLAAGLTQTELSRRSGVAQPNISAIERGDVHPRRETIERLLAASRLRPSAALRRHRDEVIAVVERHRATRPRVFGSAARGDDAAGSDVDLLVSFDDEATLLDLVRMSDELESLLGVHVDVVDDRGDARVLERARDDSVPL